MGGEDIIARREAKPATGEEEHAEIFRVAVDAGQEPEHELGTDEFAPIGRGLLGAQEEIHDPADPWAAFIFIFQRRRCSCGLAEIFLRQPHPFYR